MAGVLSLDELVGLLDRFGMRVEVDLPGAAADGVGPELVAARLAHALVGAVEAHATRAEDAARQAGAGPADLGNVALMAFAGAGCAAEDDEWALLEWRATRLAMVLSGLDFTGPFPRHDQIGAGDALVRTIRTVAAALAGMTSAKHTASNPRRGPQDARDAARALSRGMDALEQAAADAPLHRTLSQLMEMTE
ncbi:hypothetical protein [Candidatus Frankia nodulisporulans]|uniref:hypothetical protein n=1 Tax=Candidatus Frankia nodulisporulans TaxID=2060052 RepID=UPI0013D594F0|nr:hypothetical protein [Candidatus Frankia nodulisporulans]